MTWTIIETKRKRAVAHAIGIDSTTLCGSTRARMLRTLPSIPIGGCWPALTHVTGSYDKACAHCVRVERRRRNS